MTDNPQPLRIPIGRNVTYAVRGMPEVANQYGPGFLVPTEVSLTYRSTEDSQLGRFHAYVKGHWHCDGDEIGSGLPLPGQHYYGDPAGWPDWLAAEARLHDPDAAPADRAAILREAADVVDAMNEGCSRRQPCGACNAREDAADSLRRVADEVQPATSDRCPHGCDVSTCPCLACEADQPDDETQQPETQADPESLPLLFWDEPAGVVHEDGRITVWLSRAVNLAQSVPAGQLVLRAESADRLRRTLTTALNDANEAAAVSQPGKEA